MTDRRPSPAVYRRRRLMVLLLAVLVIGGVAWVLIAQPWTAFGGNDPEPAGETTATATPKPTPSASQSPDAEDGSKGAESDDATAEKDSDDPEAKKKRADAEPEACEASAVEIDPVTDKGEYGADEKPKFSMRLTNTGDVDCTMNVGTTKQVFTVLSGGDVWWRSTDCQNEPSDMLVTLKAGQEVSSAEPIAWDRTRSDVDTCGDEQRPAAPAGGASYHLRVAIGNIESESTAQFILR